MTAVALVTLDGTRLSEDSTVTVLEDGVRVAHGPVPSRVEGTGRLAPHRIVQGVADLGWRVVGYAERRQVDGGLEFDVERLG
jgi:hypothetical protein